MFVFRANNVMECIADSKYDFDPPSKGKETPLITPKKMLSNRLAVVQQTMELMGYSSKKEYEDENIQYWWDPFKTTIMIFQMCTKENLALGPDCVFRRTAKSSAWNGQNTPRKSSCPLAMRWPKGLRMLLDEIKKDLKRTSKSVFSEQKDSFSRVGDFKFMDKVLDMSEPQIYFSRRWASITRSITKLFAWGVGGIVEDMCYERRRAEACVD